MGVTAVQNNVDEDSRILVIDLEIKVVFGIEDLIEVDTKSIRVVEDENEVAIF